MLSTLVLLLLLTDVCSAIQVFNVLHFGDAKPDGNKDTTQSFLKAWEAACSSTIASTLYVPEGIYHINSATFQGPCKCRVAIAIKGTLVAPSYKSLNDHDSWLMFKGVEGVSIYGGKLDGQGQALWRCKNSHSGLCPNGAVSLTFRGSKDIRISGLTSLNSELAHLSLEECINCRVEGVHIVADANSPNTDGIHVQGSSGVDILRSSIMTGDDCISIGPGTEDLFIENVSCGPGHGISIGSLGKDANEPGVKNVTVRNVVFSGTENGLRIKSWGRPSNGFVEGVTFDGAVMNNVQNPIIIDQNYCPHDENCPNQTSGVKISGVTYRNIRGTSATQVAVEFSCSPTAPCFSLLLEDIKLRYRNRPAMSSCKNVHGTVKGFIVPPSCL